MGNEIVGCGVSNAPHNKLLKKIMSFMVALAMLFTITVGIDFSAYAISKSSSDAIKWVKSKVGTAIDYDGYYGTQCVDLILAYYNYLGVATVGGNARDYATNKLPSGWTRTKGGTPKTGDILVYAGGTGYGHVAIFESNNSLYDQSSGGKVKHQTKKYTSMVAYDGGKYWGCIHPNFSGTSTPTVTNPSVTVNAISDLTTNSVRINFTAKNPSKVTIKTIGVQVRKKGTSDWKTKQEAMNASYTNAASVPMWWTVGSGKELNMTLTSGTTYEYRAYVAYNGKNYYSSISTFTTKGPTPHTHNYNYVTVTIRPTCTEGGYTEYRCSCGDSYIGNYTSAAGHKAVTDKAVDATCTTAGKTAGSHCSVCNTVIIAQETVPAAGHSYDTGKITKQPTATTTGIKTFTCIDCGATKTETLPVTKLKTPTAKTTVNANGGFTISWNKISGADKYDVYIDNGTGYKLLRTVTGTSTTTGTAHYGKKYSYKVRAVNSKNSAVTSAFSTAVTAVNTKKLVTPKLKATVNANGGFTISWNKISGADKYDVYIDNGTGYKLLRTVTGTSTTTGTAHYGKKYSYKVRAVNSKNSAVTSAFSTAVTAVNTKKLVTPKLKATVNANGSFKLSWNRVEGATSYQLYIRQSDGSYKLMKTTNATSFTTAFAAYGKQYTYKMRAVTSKNSSATSAYSSAVNAKNTKKLQTPSLKVAVNKNGSFKLSWGKVTGATSYQIYMKQSNDSYKLIKTTTSTSFTTAVASKGKTYSYKVRAVTSKNKNATSNYSSVVSAKRK